LQYDVDPILKEFKESLKKVYGEELRSLILFGSVARGDSTKESDIDVLVILKNISNFDKEFETIFDLKMEIESKYDDLFMISAFPATEKDYLTRFSPFFLNIRKEGIQI